MAKNAREIEDYLISIGQTEFAGAMEARVNTLGGAISNLGDEWDKLWRNINDLGVGELIGAGIRLGIDVLDDINDSLASGETVAYLNLILRKFDGFGRDISETLDIIGIIWNDFIGSPEGQGISGSVNKFFNFLALNVKNLPENFRFYIRLVGIEIASLVDYGVQYGRAFGRVLGIELAILVEKAKGYGKAIGQALNFFSENTFDLEGYLSRINRSSERLSDIEFSKAENQIDIIRLVRRISLLAIKDEQEAAIDAFNSELTRISTLKDRYERLRKERQGQNDLSRFNLGVISSLGSDETPEQKAAREATGK